MPRLAYLRQPTPADARCAAGNRETRNARNPTAQRQTETAPAPKKTAATRKIATVFGSPRFGQCSDFHILAHRSSSVRFHAPRSRNPVLLVSALFRAPRYSAQRGTLRPVQAQRCPAMRFSHRSRPSYELSKYRRPQCRREGGLPARRIRQRTPLPHRQTPAKDLPLQSAPEPARPPKSTRLPACNPELRNPSSFLLPLYPPSVSKLGRTQARSKNTFAAAVPELSPDSQNLNRFRAALLVRPCKRFRPTAGSSSGPADRTSPGT